MTFLGKSVYFGTGYGVKGGGEAVDIFECGGAMYLDAFSGWR